MKEYSIGQLSKQCDVKVPTIRYYEEIALLDPPGRTAGGQRRYPPSALERLSMIAHARDLGFSIDAIREFIRMSNHPTAPCVDLDKITEKHLNDVKKRIKKLQALETELTAMLKSCDHGQVADCRILQVLSDHDQCQTQH
ncbi:MerR family transcriptional regulator [Maritalea myrionectae]|uniref:Mercuric resistance operon regulatory protein n=1 Tax=Maritalea myrionectae TaxID=454601 RepID=A0A2R4MIC0_9HYPH|nr:helix-turn-helix domain-containing protein [Maritalea myrionectae]AVX05664.1 mercuric resistance operon regulatory protein [Maritalea myrionectae]